MGRAAVDRLRPDWVYLMPRVLGVVDPGAEEGDPIAHRRLGQMASVSRHQLDDEPAVLVGLVAGVEEPPVGPVDLYVVVHVAVLLGPDLFHGPRDPLATIEHDEPIRVVDAVEHRRRRRAEAGGAADGGAGCGAPASAMAAPARGHGGGGRG